MSVTISPPEKTLMTAEEFLALPEDGVHRELIRGELVERGMTVRNRFHSRVEANAVFELKLWLKEQPEPRGEIVCGEAGFRLRGTKESIVGIDVAYASADLVASTGEKEKVYGGPPILAVEILSPSDTHEEIVSMISLYLEAGVIVWLADPDLQIISVHRAGQPPELFNVAQELSGEPYLPGFRVPVAAIFAK